MTDPADSVSEPQTGNDNTRRIEEAQEFESYIDAYRKHAPLRYEALLLQERKLRQEWTERRRARNAGSDGNICNDDVEMLALESALSRISMMSLFQVSASQYGRLKACNGRVICNSDEAWEAAYSRSMLEKYCHDSDEDFVPFIHMSGHSRRENGMKSGRYDDSLDYNGQEELCSFLKSPEDMANDFFEEYPECLRVVSEEDEDSLRDYSVTIGKLGVKDEVQAEKLSCEPDKHLKKANRSARSEILGHHNEASHGRNHEESLRSQQRIAMTNQRGQLARICNYARNSSSAAAWDSYEERLLAKQQNNISSAPGDLSHVYTIPDDDCNQSSSRRPTPAFPNAFRTAKEFAMKCDQNDAGDGYEHQQRKQDHSDQHKHRNRMGDQKSAYIEEGFNGSDTSEMRSRGGPDISAGLKRKFQPPTRKSASTSEIGGGVAARSIGPSSHRPNDKDENDDDDIPEALRGLDKELIEKIRSEILHQGDAVTFDDIAGLQDAKQTVLELVCWPMKRPDLFTGLRRAPNGLLLFGPPGTGKTLIGKAIAHESGATFFSISSSSLTSKWIGEGEKLVRTLFAVAAVHEPAVVFIDEIDSLLTQRKADENEASRRIKTEFLVQLDGTSTSGQGRVLVIGATNRPHELDDAARRRFVKRLYIPLPSTSDRRTLLLSLLDKNFHCLSEKELTRLAEDTTGFSGADLKALCTDAALGPIRQLGTQALTVDPKDVPPISFKHFRKALRGTKPSVAQSDLSVYLEWNDIFGSKGITEGESLSFDSDDNDA